MAEEYIKPTEEKLEQNLQEFLKKKKAGAPLGNQNARKHGIYSKALTPAERRYFDRAVSSEGLELEIALFRLKIMSLLETEPVNMALVAKVFYTLNAMVSTERSINRDNKDKGSQALLNLLKDIVLPSGIDVEKVFKKE